MGAVQYISFSKKYSELSGVNSVPWSESFRTNFQAQIPFLYETAFLNGQEALMPWRILVIIFRKFCRNGKN